MTSHHTADLSRKKALGRALLGGLTPAKFLKDYWQKRPLLVRGAWPDFADPLSPDELAGLAMNEAAHSRLVMERGGKKPWQLQHGPFSEKQLTSLPSSHWTLLVSNVEHWVEAAALILDRFNFIPHWRADDLMVSFAPEQGSVGPHLDSYDVFLLQGKGQRRWGIATEPDLRFKQGVDLKLLRHFEAESEWVLNPGDMLYLPPGVAHYGVALSECLTYSIGFRAPAQRDLLADFYNLPEYLATLVETEALYTDPGIEVQANPGAIGGAALARVRAMLLAPLDNPELLGRWFGAHVTRPAKRQEQPSGRKPSRERLIALLKSERQVWRSDASRWAFFAPDKPKDFVYLYLDGEEWPLPRELLGLVEQITGVRRMAASELAAALPKAKKSRDDGLSLLANLLGRGALYLAPPRG